MIRHEIAHRLEPSAVAARVNDAFTYYQERFGKYEPTLQWMTPERAELSFKARGLKLNGTLSIKPEGLVVEMDVPLLLRPFRGKAVEVIEREAARWL